MCIRDRGYVTPEYAKAGTEIAVVVREKPLRAEEMCIRDRYSPSCSVPHTSWMITAIFSSEMRFCDDWM